MAGFVLHIESEVDNSRETANVDVLPIGEGVLIINEVKVIPGAA